MSLTTNDYRRTFVSQSERQLNVTQRVTAGHGTGMCDMWRSSLVDRKVKGVKGKCSPALESGGKRSGERSMSTVAAGRGDTSCFDAPFVSAHHSTILGSRPYTSPLWQNR